MAGTLFSYTNNFNTNNVDTMILGERIMMVMPPVEGHFEIPPNNKIPYHELRGKIFRESRAIVLAVETKQRNEVFNNRKA